MNASPPSDTGSAPGTPPTVVALIPAAGRGKRLGGGVPKQYQDVLGKPLLSHTLECFQQSSDVDAIVLIVHPEDQDTYAARVLEAGEFDKIRDVVDGGEERSDSVRAGLRATRDEDDIVLVHDGARPLVSAELIERVVRAAAQFGAAIPAIAVKDTVKEVADGVVVGTPPRGGLWAAQTPQGFRRALLLEAFDASPQTGSEVTDEASLVERLGAPVHIVEGDGANLKVTTAADLDTVEWSMLGQTGGSPSPSTRIGQGYDVHPFGPDSTARARRNPDRASPGPGGGTQDADVLTHAIIDALLGATALEDIGRQFPDSDPQYKDISSLVLLEQVRRLLEGRKGTRRQHRRRSHGAGPASGAPHGRNDGGHRQRLEGGAGHRVPESDDDRTTRFRGPRGGHRGSGGRAGGDPMTAWSRDGLRAEGRMSGTWKNC